MNRIITPSQIQKMKEKSLEEKRLKQLEDFIERAPDGSKKPSLIRKKTHKKENIETIVVRMETKEVGQLDQIAEMEGTSRNSLIVRTLRQLIKSRLLEE